MCQDALNGPSRLRETRRTSPLAHPTTSRPKPKAWVGRVAHGAPPPYMGPYGPRIYHRTTLTELLFPRPLECFDRLGNRAGCGQSEWDTVIPYSDQDQRSRYLWMILVIIFMY